MVTTYYPSDTNSADVTDGTDFNKTMETSAPPGPVAHAKTNISGGAADVKSHTYTTPGAVPNLTTWPAGNYIAYLDVTTIGADVSYKIAIARVNSSGSLVETLGTSAAKTATGLQSHTVNLASPKTVPAGDRFQIYILVSRAASHGNQTFENTIGASAALSRLETPIAVGYEVTASPAAFSMTPAAIGSSAARSASASPGSFALSGAPLGAAAQRSLSASPAAFSLSGAAVAAVRAAVVSATAASFALAGADLSAEPGTTGQSATASPAAFALTGASISIAVARRVEASPASYALAGASIAAQAARVASIAPASYALTGASMSAARGYQVSLSPAAFSLTGADLNPLVARVVSPSAGAFVLTGKVIVAQVPGGSGETTVVIVRFGL